MHQKFLGIARTVRLVRSYLKGSRFTIQTDNESLMWLMIVSEASANLTRWRLQLSEFKFYIVHRAGIKHKAADPMSKILTGGKDKTKVDDKISF